MKSLLVVLILVLTVQNRAYNYDKPEISFRQEDVVHNLHRTAAFRSSGRIFKCYNNKNFEVTMSASREVLEKHLPPNKELFLVHLNPSVNVAPVQQGHQPFAKSFGYPQPVIMSTPNPGFHGNLQNSFNNPQQYLNSNSKQYNELAAVDNAQHHNNQFTANSNYQHHQQQQQSYQQQQAGINSQSALSQSQEPARAQQFGALSQSAAQQFHTFSQIAQQQQQQPLTLSQGGQQLQQQQQQQYYHPQQYENYLQQPPLNNNLPNSNNLLNDLVNNHKYVSQSEASQLNVYTYNQMNGNPRPFTRISNKCTVWGQCEPQNAADGSDLLHQQVLQQSKAKVEPSADKCSTKFNYQFAGNALTGDAAKAQRGIPIFKGTNLKDRRLFAYNEVEIQQYPHN